MFERLRKTGMGGILLYTVKTIYLSDIHGNLEALDAVREEIRGENAGRVYCLGDVVGYGADPDTCWKIVRDEGWETTLGNHDEAVLDPSGLIMMNPVARQALQWTRANISEEGIGWLESLADVIRPADGVIASHALPMEPRAWLYSDDPNAVTSTFHSMGEKLMFVGHLHFAHAWHLLISENRIELIRVPERIELDAGRWMINVGSVGQPRDGDHRACYVVHDDAAGLVEYRRVQYDTVTAARKIVDQGLPEVLAQRLFVGQ